jgi:hypothetical protein
MWPPQGWRFRQPETGWTAPGGQTFGQVVEAIIAHRQQNPRFKLSTDRATVENELDDYTCAILKNDEHWCVGSTVASFSVPLPAFPKLEEARRSAAGGVKFLANTKVGIKTWMEWFGHGIPVSRTQAEERGNVCVSCPLNQKGNLMDRFTKAAADEILAIFAAMNDLNLHTSNEAHLHVCQGCSCPLRAKCWVPFDVIAKHMKEETWGKLDPACWMLKERAS